MALSDYFHFRVDGEKSLSCGVDLRPTNSVDAVKDLALQIGCVDLIEIDDRERSYACRSQIKRHRRSEPPRTNDRHLGVEELTLALLSHLGKYEMACITLTLFGGQWRIGHLDRITLITPALDAPGERSRP